jgi:ATP-dependent DNA ligase
MQNIVEDEGEGVILRKCGSPYEHGRTPLLVKLKVYIFYKFHFVI